MTVPTTQITGVAGFYKGRTASFQHAKITIGRDHGNSMQFPLDLALSRFHAVLEFNGFSWTVCDVESRNGTLVNGRRLSPNSVTTIKSGDEIRCGYQAFILEWASPYLSTPQNGTSAPATEPIPVGKQLVVPPPRIHRIPPPLTPVQVAKQASSKESPESPSAAGRWVLPGKPIVIHQRTISCGLFYFGSSLKDVSGYGTEPSLIDPQLPAKGTDQGDSDVPLLSPNFRTISEGERASYLDWLAAGRPESRVSELNALLFLSGVERRLFCDKNTCAEERAYVLSEVNRILHGLPQRSYASVRLREFQIAANPTLDPRTIPLDDAEVPSILALLLSKKAATSTPMSANEALYAVIADPETYTRTPFERCRNEVCFMFSILYQKKYGEGVIPKQISSKLKLVYEPINNRIPHQSREISGFSGGKIAQPTLLKLREFLQAATDELDLYSRRLAGRPNEAGCLPAVGLLPEAFAVVNPSLLSLKQIAIKSQEDRGRIPMQDLATLLPEWSGERTFTKVEREMLSKALWHAGFVMEPNHSVATSVSLSSTIFVTPRSIESKFEPSSTFMSCLPLITLAALIAVADGQLDEKERHHVASSLTRITNLSPSETRRLELFLDWLLETGAPKIGKKIFEAISPELRNPLLQILCEVAAVDGSVTPPEIKELIRVAAGLGSTEQELYSMLHEVQSRHRSQSRANPIMSDHGLDEELIKAKLLSSEISSDLLAGVFIQDEESLPAPSHAVVFSESVNASAPTDPLRNIVEELSHRQEMSEAEFQAFATRYEKMPNALYELLNELAFESIGDPLLEGEDPIQVHSDVAQELLR